MSNNKKLKAAAKMVKGAAQVVSGVVTGTGHGVVGTALKNAHMTRGAAELGKRSIKKGAKNCEDGMREFNE